MSYALLMAGFMVTTFIYAICWHLVIFKNVYDSIGIYTRETPIIPIGVLTVLVQGAVFAFLYVRFDVGESVILKGTILGLLLGVFEFCAGSLAFAAKRNMEKFWTWIAIQFALSVTIFPLSGTVAALLSSVL